MVHGPESFKNCIRCCSIRTSLSRRESCAEAVVYLAVARNLILFISDKKGTLQEGSFKEVPIHW